MFEMGITIVGGSSALGKISIASEQFISTAVCGEDGKISCQIEKNSWLKTFLVKHRYLPIPRILRLALILSDGMLKRILTDLKITDLISLVIDIFLVRITYLYVSKHGFEPIFRQTFDSREFCFILTFVVGYAIYKISPIRRWHGAEHMAIASFERNASVELEDIKKESRVHPKCGGRFLLPLICIAIMVPGVSSYFAINSFLVLILSFEGALWVDTFFGWDRVWVFSQASFFLQKYLTTREPKEKEIKTAQMALEYLVKAHEWFKL